MKQGKSLVQLYGTLQEQLKTKKDYGAATTAMTVTPDRTVVLDSVGEFAMRDNFQSQLATEISYPYEFFKRSYLSFPDATANLVNEMLHANDKRHLVRTLGYDNVLSARALLSNKYRVLDNYDVADAVIQAIGDLGDGWQVDSCELTESKMYIKILTPVIRDVRVGDPVRAGFVVSNSEIGKGRTTVEHLVFRLVCSNGAIVQDTGLARNHAGRAQFAEADGAWELLSDETKEASDRALLLQVRDLVTAATNDDKFKIIVDKFAAATERKIETDPIKVVERVQKLHGLTDNERGGILARLMGNSARDGMTQYGLVGAVTEQAQHVESYDRSVELEKIGGAMFDMMPEQWRVLSTN